MTQDLALSNLQTIVKLQVSDETWTIQPVGSSSFVRVTREQAIQELQAAIERFEIPQEVITDLPMDIFSELCLTLDPALYHKRNQTPIWSAVRTTASRLFPSPFLTEWHGN
jgi:hypothetical protein